jgi:hypothetical protein
LRRIAIFGSLLLLFSLSRAEAGQIAVGDARVAFAPPAGHCELDRSQPQDAEFIDSMATAMGSGVRILSTFARCDQLAVWRKGLLTYLRDYGFLTVARSDERRSVADARPAVMHALAREMRRADAESQNEPALPGELDRTDHLGVLHADDKAVYYGQINDVETPEGLQRGSLELGAMTLIKGKLVSYLLFGEFAGRPSVDALLGQQRTNMDRLIAAN